LGLGGREAEPSSPPAPELELGSTGMIGALESSPGNGLSLEDFGCGFAASGFAAGF